MSALELFTSDAWTVRAKMGIGGDDGPWFVATDVCTALGIANNRDAVASLDDDEKGVGTADTLGGPQQVVFINEPGLYSLVLRSRRPEAKAFKRWITHDVLPAIRRTGSYTAAPATAAEMPSHAESLRGWADALERAERAELENAVLAPKAALADDLLSADGTHTIAEAAQILSNIPGVEIGAGRLRDYLRSIGWITKDRRAPRAMQTQIIAGRLVMKEDPYTTPDGIVHVKHQIRVTPKGLAELHRLLAGTPQLTLVLGGAS